MPQRAQPLRRSLCIRQHRSHVHAGDVRMALAEDSKKVDNIVTGSMSILREIYSPEVLSQAGLQQMSIPQHNTMPAQGEVYQVPSTDTQRRWISSLPSVRLFLLQP